VTSLSVLGTGGQRYQPTVTVTAPGFGEAGPSALGGGACCAWPLATDGTCAREARRIFRAAASAAGIEENLADDGVTMASELAANTLHARADSGTPEIWLYLRRASHGWELVCKVFDALRGWKRGLPPVPGQARNDAVTGRGLHVVEMLSEGRWGHHLTRSRLGGWKVPGKAVWFALPAPPPEHRAREWVYRSRIGPCHAARDLEAMLSDRGLADGLMVTHEPAAGMAVLSVRCGLTIWCRPGMIAWRTRAGRYQRQAVTDLIDAAEQIVCTCEEIVRGVGAGDTGLSRVR
jgi:hypothetical protein